MFWPTRTWSLFAAGLYWAMETVMSYVPGRRPARVKPPSAPEVASKVNPLAASLATMLAPGSAARLVLDDAADGGAGGLGRGGNGEGEGDETRDRQ